MNSNNLSKLFKNKPNLWNEYHNELQKSENLFNADSQEQIPYKRIIRYLNNIKLRRNINIADLGCGMNRIYEALKNNDKFTFYSYDHVPKNDKVIQADISKLPLEDNTMDIVILCLAMWGSNCHNYLDEVNRVLDYRGELLIIEPTNRWIDKDTYNNKLQELLINKGFIILDSNYDSNEPDKDKFIFLKAIKI
jgi:ubiquinone/menaquinone biosynthesis C-methylase UbiE